MSAGQSNRPDNLEEALSVFADWVREQWTQGRSDFEQVCASRPELAEELRRLHSLFQLAQAAAGSRSFHQTLHEQFGDVAEVTVQLDEGAAPLPRSQTLANQAGDAAASATPSSARYTLEDEVAHGGMGVIWRVRDRDLSRTLAMKVMTGAPGTSAATDATSRLNLARFLEEAQVTAQLDHPGIVPVHEAGFDAQGQPFFIMKLVKGRDLNEIFKLARAEQEGWNLPRAVGVIVKACQALAYAHTKGVIHRDLKPANIMVGRFGEVYVMDWGLAKITGRKDLHDIRPKDMQLASASVHSKRHEDAASTPDSPLITMDGSVVGTPAYMAPEQARGQVEDVDQASDIYSLGTILYNLLTGQPPYVEASARLSPHTILGMVVQGPPRRIHQLNPQASPELIAICEKAMAREKKDRYTSSLDLSEDLQAFLDHRVVRAYRTGAVAEFKSWVARNRGLASFSAAVGIIVIFATAATIVRQQQANLHLKRSLAQQYLRRGHALCESGDITRGLHWFARALNEAPRNSTSLRAVIRENLAAWSRDLNTPIAILHHESFIDNAILSPDGTRVATSPIDNTARLWSAVTGESIGNPMHHEGRVNILVFSPDSKILLTGSLDNIARFWSAETAKAIGPRLHHDGVVNSAAFSADATRVLTAAGIAAMLWSLESGERLGPPLQHDDVVLSVAFSPDGLTALTAGRDATARLWSLPTTGSATYVMRHPAPVWKAFFTPDAALLLTVTTQAVHFWASTTGLAVGASIEPGARVLAIAASSDRTRIVTAGADKAARIWSVQTRQPVGAMMVHQHNIPAVAFSPDNKFVLTGSEDNTARLWSAETGEPIGAPMLLPSRIAGVAFSPDGKYALMHPAGHTVLVYALSPARENTLKLQDSPIRIPAFAFSPDGKRLAGGVWARSPDLGARMWSTDTGQRIGPVMKHEEAVWAVAFSPDGKTLLTGSRDRTARLWSADTGAALGFRVEHKAEVRAVAFSPDGKLAATGSFDKTARIWSTKTSQPVGPSLEHSAPLEDVVFSPDGASLLTACSDGAARLWSVHTSKLLLPPMWHRAAVLAAVFSPAGDRVITGGRDNVVRFWNAANGRPTGLVLEHPGWVEDVCFAVDGRRLWTVTPNSVRVWDVETGELLGPPLALKGNGVEIALSSDGRRFAVAEGRPGEVRFRSLFGSEGFVQHAALWVEVLTWTEMHDHGALSWLDHATWKARREELEKLGGPALK